MKKNSYWKPIAACITWLCVICIWGLAMFTAVSRILGYTPYIVISGSMEPYIPVGSVVYVEEIPEGEDPVTGEIVAFQTEDGSEVIHRIAGKDEFSGEYTTKGDANNTEDGSTITREQMLGRYKSHIPNVGYLLSGIDSHTVRFGSMELPAIVPIMIGILIMVNLAAHVADEHIRKGKKEPPSE